MPENMNQTGESICQAPQGDVHQARRHTTPQTRRTATPTMDAVLLDCGRELLLSGSGDAAPQAASYKAKHTFSPDVWQLCSLVPTQRRGQAHTETHTHLTTALLTTTSSGSSPDVLQ